MSCVNLNGAQKSGTGVTDVDADSSMISFSNNGTTKFDMLGDSTINTDLLLANTKGLNFKDAAGNTVPGVTMDSGDNLIIGDVNGNLDAITIKTQNGQTMTFQHGAAPSLTILDGAVDVPNGAFTVATDKFTVTSAGHVTIGDGTAGVDYTLTFNGETSDGVLTWMEDEDYFQFADAVLLDLTLTVSGTTHSTGRLSAGLLGTDGTAHILTASAGTVAANANADEGVFENSGNTGISILAPDANVCSVYFGTPSDNLGAFFQWDYSGTAFTMGSHIAGGTLRFSTAINQTALTIDASQDTTIHKNLTIGDGTAATDFTLTFNGETSDGVIQWMEDEDAFYFQDNVGIGTGTPETTLGLTIDQGAADDIILSLKSSDVAHGITDIAETDTYGMFKKESATLGGLEMSGLAEIDGVGVRINAYADRTGS